MATEIKGTAAITGASSGLGEVFARKLAARGYDLLLVARREAKLQTLASELASEHGVAAEALRADLSFDDDVSRLEHRLASERDLALLVNDAGFGLSGSFTSVDVEASLRMVQVHVVAPVRLTRAALPAMLARGRGAVINVSSIAAFLPSAGNVVYSATKASLISFSECLALELAGTGVKVQALCPGFTRTGFYGTVEFRGTGAPPLPEFMWGTAEAVVEASLRALEGRRVVVVPGLVNKLSVALRGPSNALSRRAARRRSPASPPEDV